MARISIKDLKTAEDWLRDNEGGDGEADSCRRVAAWINEEIERRQIDAAVRQIKSQVPSATTSKIKARLANIRT